ncbi:MAG: translation initiation factor IF-2 N-terminal domain-containing protein, partial [Oscillospiraceae bacterium]
MTIKYRVHEVAKDFNADTKEVTEILTKYATTPKNHMQALEENELSLVFEALTQNHQMKSIEEVFSETYHEPKPVEAPKPVEPPKAAAPAPAAPVAGETAGAVTAPVAAAGTAPAAAPVKPAVVLGRPTTRVPEKKIVDTRTGNAVNMEKYDERLEKLAPAQAKNMSAGKQKFMGRPGQRRPGPNFGNKRRQEEQEKMRRLQAEIAKKNPLKVMIPEEIAVGELALRMKKTAAEVIKQLMKLGVMASISDNVDFDTASLVAMELGCKVEKEVIVTIEEKLIDTAEDKDEDLTPRA